MSRPRGSGLFAAAFGVLFLAAFIVSFFPGLHFDKIPPVDILRVWLVFIAAVLIGWGVNRVVKTDDKGLNVGQDTIAFVIGIVAATLALLELVNHPR